MQLSAVFYDVKALVQAVCHFVKALQVLLNDLHRAVYGGKLDGDGGKLDGDHIEFPVHLSSKHIHLASQSCDFSAICLRIPDEAENDKEYRYANGHEQLCICHGAIIGWPGQAELLPVPSV